MTLAVNRRSSESVRRALRFFPEPSLIYTALRGKAQYSWVTSTRSKGIAPFHQLRSVAFAKLPVGRHTPSGDIGSGLAVRFCHRPLPKVPSSTNVAMHCAITGTGSDACAHHSISAPSLVRLYHSMFRLRCQHQFNDNPGRQHLLYLHLNADLIL